MSLAVGRGSGRPEMREVGDTRQVPRSGSAGSGEQLVEMEGGTRGPGRHPPPARAEPWALNLCSPLSLS